MSKVKELYIALRDDPDLDIPEGESRESAAWNETSQRMRQHKTNAKALALAAEVSESTAVEKLNNFNETYLQKVFGWGKYEYTRRPDGTEEFLFNGKPANEKQKQKIIEQREKEGQKVTTMSDKQKKKLKDTIENARKSGNSWSNEDKEAVENKLQPNSPLNVKHDIEQKDTPRRQSTEIKDSDGNTIHKTEIKKPLLGGKPKTTYTYHLDKNTKFSFSGEGDYEHGVRNEVDQILDRFRAVPEESRGKDASKKLKNLLQKYTGNKTPSQKDYDDFIAEVNKFEDDNINLSREEINEAVNKGEVDRLSKDSLEGNEKVSEQLSDNQGAGVLRRDANVLTPAKAKKGLDKMEAQPYGAFPSKAAMSRTLQDMTGDKFTKTELNKFVNDLTPAQRNNLGNNINKYFNPANADDALDIHGSMADWAFSLPKDDINNLFNHLSDNKQPFTVDAGVAGKELRDKGYVDKGIRASGGKYPLSLQGAAHLIQAGMNLGTSSKNPYHISATKFNKNSEDLSNEDNWIGPEQVEQPVTTEDKQNDLANRLVQAGIVTDKKEAREFVNKLSNDNTNFETLEDNIYDYFDDFGGESLQPKDFEPHIKNITDNTRDFSGLGESASSTDTSEKVSEPEAFKPIKIYDYGNFTADDFDSDGKLKPAIFGEDGDLEFLSDSEKEHLQNITFQSGQDYEAGKNIPEPKVETQEPKADTKVSKPKSTKAESSKTTSDKKSETTEAKSDKKSETTDKDRLVAHAKELNDNLRNAYKPTEIFARTGEKPTEAEQGRNKKLALLFYRGMTIES